LIEQNNTNKKTNNKTHKQTKKQNRLTIITSMNRRNNQIAKAIRRQKINTHNHKLLRTVKCGIGEFRGGAQ